MASVPLFLKSQICHLLFFIVVSSAASGSGHLSRPLGRDGIADEEHQRLAAARSLQEQQQQANPGPAGIALSPSMGIIPSAGLGESCLTGFTVGPAMCAPGLYCEPNATEVTGSNPVPAGTPGICRDPNSDTAWLGERCTVGGNVKPVECGPGLYCLVPSNSTSAGTVSSTEAAMAPSGLPNPDAAQNGTCQPVNATGPGDSCSDSTAANCSAGPGEMCRTGGNVRPIVCQPGLVCQVEGMGTPVPRIPQGGAAAASAGRMDFASVGVCTVPGNGTVNGTVFNSTGAEGDPCTAPGARPQVSIQFMPCQPGLICDTSGYSLYNPLPPTVPLDQPATSSSSASLAGATSAASETGMMPHRFGPGVGVCRPPSAPGQPCFATNASVDSSGTGSDWSWNCASGLVCLVLDSTSSVGCNSSSNPGAAPPANDSSAAQPGSTDSKHADVYPEGERGAPGSMHPGSGWGPMMSGYCFNTSDDPGRNNSSAPGAEGSQCIMGSSNSSSGSCDAGLTCVANAAGITSSSNSSTGTGSALRAAQVSGVCANATQLLNLVNFAGSGSGATAPGGSTENVPATGGSSDTNSQNSTSASGTSPPANSDSKGQLRAVCTSATLHATAAAAALAFLVL